MSSLVNPWVWEVAVSGKNVVTGKKYVSHTTALGDTDGKHYFFQGVSEPTKVGNKNRVGA
jgi:hypothetical protein